ncbi:CBS domain-containing protein [Aliidiomarina halalkaliphila]|uniref:CBS domain-containing protein n=1 Tax=Aliidiomarina halalkaliphila TaxID=2593535 RepID=A0A552X472_9GAMM|nr:CBS domain-containing protein [Aliidiomarina halalkaliphila]TRW49830.1 CBS domain-containing protein [Aliidiomarina halalkaliphila]
MRSMKVHDYMNRHPVKFTREMPVETAVAMLIAASQSGGPVVDDDKQVIGFLSEQDCLAMMLEGTYHKEQSATVADCMSNEVVTVNSDMAILDLAQELGNKRPKVYPVVDYAKQLVGVISRTDVLRAIDLHLRDSYANH